MKYSVSLGGLAGLIAAISFAVLVAFICLNLSKVADVIKEVSVTVNKLNNTIDIVTKDVDNLSIEVEGLLNKTNALVDDVGGKLNKTDPLFTAIGDLGETVSEVNDSTKAMASNLLSGASFRKKKPNKLSRIARIAKPTINRKRTYTTDYSRKGQPVKQQPIRSTEHYWTQEENDLFNLTDKQPSKTAGEVVNKK